MCAAARPDTVVTSILTSDTGNLVLVLPADHLSLDTRHCPWEVL